MNNDDLDKCLKDAEKAANEARLKTELAALKLEKFRMQLNLKTSDCEKFRNIEARIKELEAYD
jgi:ribosomal protein L29